MKKITILYEIQSLIKIYNYQLNSKRKMVMKKYVKF